VDPVEKRRRALVRTSFRTWNVLVKVFISHAGEDGDIARELADSLEAAGHQVWDPGSSLLPGDNAPLRIGQALSSSNAMVVLVSPASAKSEAVQREVQFAIGSPRYQGRLVSLVVRPTRGIPWLLRRLPLVRVAPARSSCPTPTRTRRSPTVWSAYSEATGFALGTAGNMSSARNAGTMRLGRRSTVAIGSW
jgi:hypothetical protein